MDMENRTRVGVTGFFLVSALAAALLFAPAAGPAAGADGPASGGSEGPRAWRPLAIAAFAGGTAFLSGDLPDGGLSYGGGIRWRMSKTFGLGALIEKYSGDALVGTNVMLNSYVFFSGGRRFSPYAIVGLGFNSVEFNPDREYNIDPGEIVDRMALQLGGGLEWRVLPPVSVTAEARSNLIKTWIMTGPAPERIRDIDPRTRDIIHLYGLTLTAGLKFSF
jgi:opacity protein-like surface antigen